MINSLYYWIYTGINYSRENRKPNAKTLAAMQELENFGGECF